MSFSLNMYTINQKSKCLLIIKTIRMVTANFPFTSVLLYNIQVQVFPI